MKKPWKLVETVIVDAFPSATTRRRVVASYTERDRAIAGLFSLVVVWPDRLLCVERDGRTILSWPSDATEIRRMCAARVT